MDSCLFVHSSFVIKHGVHHLSASVFNTGSNTLKRGYTLHKNKQLQQQHRQTSRRSSLSIHASFKEDFFRGPSSPPRPRPVYQVALFSITTNLLWYGYYKYCIEEELRKETGNGLGGFLTLFPFVVGICSPLYIKDTTIAAAGALSGLGWILAMQYWLTRRVNALYIDTFGGDGVLTPWWAFIPPFNVISGLRIIHFLAVIWGAGKHDDPFVNFFPFVGVEKLGMGQLITTPSLWVSFGASDSDKKEG